MSETEEQENETDADWQRTTPRSRDYLYPQEHMLKVIRFPMKCTRCVNDETRMIFHSPKPLRRWLSAQIAKTASIEAY